VGAQRVAVIGIGLNLRPLPAAEVPPGLAWGRAALQELWPGLDAPAALARVLPPLAQALRGFVRHGFAPLQAAFARRDVLAGRTVTTTLPTLPHGTADGVDGSGTLWLRTADGRHAVASGEVSLRPAAPSTPAAPAAGG
jgi:BirA family biotin operon repressor/biotin-[acetyl-CoA-carboxylase] ligase